MPGCNYCCVFGCTNSAKTAPHLTFFSVPKDDQRRRLWADLIDREDLISNTIRAYVCSSHFDDSLIKNRRLKWEALPSVNLPENSVAANATLEGLKSLVVCVPAEMEGEVKQPESNPQSAPVFIDVCAGSVQYPISVVLNDNTPATEQNVATNIKEEPQNNIERSTSPLAPFLQIQPRRIRCTECSKYTAETEEKMLRHVRKVHRGENPFQCYMCDYSTYNKSLFEEHVRIHQGIKPFKCSHCPYRSASKKNTKKHELIHRPDNPHKCNHCGFIARHLRSLHCHINTKHQGGTWLDTAQTKLDKELTPCQYCKRKFDDVVTHEKNRKECPECSKIFCNKSLLKKHLGSVHGDKHRLSKDGFECAICKWCSNVKPRILLHLIHHPNQEIDPSTIDVTVLKECGIVGPGW